MATARRVNHETPVLSAAGQNALRRVRERRGLPVGALAAELGISRKHLSQVLNGRAPLMGTLAARLPAALGLSPELVGALLKRPRTTARPPIGRGCAKGMIEVREEDPTSPLPVWEAG